MSPSTRTRRKNETSEVKMPTEKATLRITSFTPDVFVVGDLTVTREWTEVPASRADEFIAVAEEHNIRVERKPEKTEDPPVQTASTEKTEEGD
jgi:hypothetical protein